VSRGAVPAVWTDLTGTAWRPMDVPVDLGRDDAQELARRELSDPVYDAEPSLLERAIGWVVDQINELLFRTTGALSSWVGIAVLAGVVVLVTIVVARRMGPLARRAASARRMFDRVGRTSADYRAAAEAAAQLGDWSTAVVERYRAVVAGLEERGVLDPRPGRTADEAAAEAGSVIASVAADLGMGARLFDQVRYGGRLATREDDATLRRLDDALRAAKPAVALDVPAVPL
jgi:Domain of unknown function (DUF4129)